MIAGGDTVIVGGEPVIGVNLGSIERPPVLTGGGDCTGVYDVGGE